MNKALCSEIQRFVLENPGNRFPGDDGHYFDEPLIGFAAADDPLFTQYKQIIGEFHRTPQEIIDHNFDLSVQAATVICWILPIAQATRISNRLEKLYPSKAWALTRSSGEQFNAHLARHIANWLTSQGWHAVVPQQAPGWQSFPNTPVGIASTWSERHAAYAAGLGTFSLNDALITPRGIAHRCGSVITDLRLEPTPRPYPDFRHNCLFFREGSCGACICRCPAGAISKNGHDKNVCRKYVYETIIDAVAENFGIEQTGCGLCQTAVPCEEHIPVGKIIS